MGSLPGMEESRPRKSTVNDEFEKVWSLYPRKTGKSACLRVCLTRVAQGAKWEELILAAQNYAADCQDREERFIKHGATFYGPDHWWKDYLEIRQDSPQEHPLISAGRKMAKKYQPTPDRFGDHA